MSESTELIIGIGALLILIVLVRRIHAWQLRRAYRSIITDLRKNQAIDPTSAIALPYSRKSLLKMGIRDFRTMALEHLTLNDIVGITDDARYYLKEKSVQHI